MKQKLARILVVSLLVVLLVPGFVTAKIFKIGVTVIVSHPALEADQKGFETALKDAGVEAEYDYQNAQGEMPNAQAIAQKFAADKVDMVHAMQDEVHARAPPRVRFPVERGAVQPVFGERPGEHAGGERDGADPPRHAAHRRPDHEGRSGR